MLKVENLAIIEIGERFFSVDDMNRNMTIRTCRTRDEAERFIEEIRNRPMTYHVALGKDRHEIEHYIEDMAEIVGDVLVRGNGHVVAVIVTEQCNSDWVYGRLASGMMGGRPYPSKEAAETDAVILAGL